MSRRRATRFALALALALSAPALARAQFVDLPGTQPHALDSAEALDTAARCADCHAESPSVERSTMPHNSWLGSLMGNTMRDPLFLAALTVAEQDRPQIGDYCLRCHTPPGFVGGRTRSSATAGRGTDLTASDLDGVSCDSCHRMTATPTTQLGNAQYALATDNTRFGPRDDAFSMRHASTQSSWLADARMCGTCHEITNPARPAREADGGATGRAFALDTTYSEWAGSAFAQRSDSQARTCQDCHLPRAMAPGFTATSSSAMERASPRLHAFAGGNAWMLRVLAAMRADQTLAGFYDPSVLPLYERAVLRDEEQLRAAARLTIRNAPASARAGETIAIDVRLENLSGHKLPTGYADGRRVWLAVELVDAAGAVTPVSGGYDAAEARLDPSDPQLRVYEAVHGRAGLGPEEHIALHDTVVRDTRIPPRGLVPTDVTAPVGRDYRGGDNGALRHWDDAHYAATVPTDARGPIAVRVRALYQPTTREYVEFLERENHTDDRGRILRARWEASGRAAPFAMATATAMVATSAGTDAGADGGAAMEQGGCGCRAAGRESRPGPSAGWIGLLAALFLARRRTARAPRITP